MWFVVVVCFILCVGMQRRQRRFDMAFSSLTSQDSQMASQCDTVRQLLLSFNEQLKDGARDVSPLREAAPAPRLMLVTPGVRRGKLVGNKANRNQ